MKVTQTPSLAETLLRFARKQPLEEVSRQYGVIRRMEVDRRVLSCIAFLTASVFLPFWVCLVLFVLDTVSELLGYLLLGRLDPPNQPMRYFFMLASYAVSQASYCILPVLCWQLDDPLAKSYAVGLTLVSLIHIATVRTVHLPLAMVGGGAITFFSLIGNGYFWLQSGNLSGFLISTACILAASYFASVTILSVHRLHDDMLFESRAAQAADLAKSRFLAQMSHELRTPLNAILGMGTAELAVAQTPEGRERLSILVQSAKGLSVMLDDILDLSAVQAGQLPIRPQALDLPEEIASTVAMFRQQVEDAGLILRFSLHDSVPPYAMIDGQRLRQCLSNILSNAVKYTKIGLISVYAYEQQPGLLAIKVADSGPGVPEPLREKIFEPFYRGEVNVPGTGLGMSISRTLARRMGGDLVLLPSVSGAHFLLTLAYEPTKSAPVTTDAGSGASLAGARVLIVDDIGTNRVVAATYLRLLGAVPIEADSGAAALAHLTGPAPADLVLLDLLMPDMDGMETLRRIRALPGPLAAIPVIALSADTTESHRSDRDPIRFDAFAQKPLSAEGLSAILLPFVAQMRAKPRASA